MAREIDMIQPTRIKVLNAKDNKKGEFVLYWMQASQRAECNHALEYAVRKANELRQPVVVFFGLTPAFPEANERHYAFLLEGLAETVRKLEKRGIRCVVRSVSPELGVRALSERASLVVTDRGYLKIQRSWRDKAAAVLDCPLLQVEADAVVPVEEASPKEEYAAATIRPKIRRKLPEYLTALKEHRPAKDSLGMDFEENVDLEDIPRVLGRLRIDTSVKKTEFYTGGTEQAKMHLQRFLKDKLDHFRDLRNNPTLDYLSHLSPYLHFGQISPLSVALKALETESPGREAFLEELVVRRELSLNFVFYNSLYDAYEGLPAWARKTLEAHKADARAAAYSLADLESAQTEDPYWNAAQLEAILTGKMHGYMRMYWGKKIIEWSRTPEEAFRTALYLNNKYELDGRDPNGFTGVAWCFGKHDRPWQGRPIFGNTRYMNDRGLRRKFDADHYVRMIEKLRD
jgi:deoxyribodipyrimidine photo-lyase